MIKLEGLFWIWWVKCILRYSPAGERVEGTTKTQRTQRSNVPDKKEGSYG